VSSICGRSLSASLLSSSADLEIELDTITAFSVADRQIVFARLFMTFLVYQIDRSKCPLQTRSMRRA
jgi:hypothetical protein